MSHNYTIVLNANWEIHQKVSHRHALEMLRRGVAEVIAYTNNIFRTFTQEIKVPQVIRLINFVRKIFQTKVPYKRQHLFTRDKYMCAYCGLKFDIKDLSEDHIFPQSRGGESSWENCVSACKPCNNKKGNKTPREANMFLKIKPYEPTIAEFTRLKMASDGLEKFVSDLLNEQMI